ncbi:DUF305 domain-containing protein [Microbacterium sp. NPDC055910]|uniref:DUF305 domain-containing protein n=1 Tax=Microbacterium sp. NPDC055910 TaxID=3345659 RepID=UPI0035DBCDE6
MPVSPRFLPLGAAVVIALGLTACTAEPEASAPVPTAPVIQPGAPGEPNRTLSPEEAAAIQSEPHNDADVVFVRDMMHHHSQALIMTSYVEERTSNRDIRLLAERMDMSQSAELERFEAWLQARGEAPRDPDAGHAAHADMPGLLTDAELAQLEAARDAAFDRLFLELMIKHHEGAVEMVIDLYASGGGRETELDVMAGHIEADQGIEISRMQEMLAARS